MKKKILILKTGREWLLNYGIEELKKKYKDAVYSIIANSDVEKNFYKNIYKYKSGTKLSIENMDFNEMEKIKQEKFDKAVYLMSANIPAMYRHIDELIKYLGIKEHESIFKHSPDGGYDQRFKQGFWSKNENIGIWYVKSLMDKINILPEINPVILDVGCGCGMFTDYYYSLGYKKVIGCDSSRVGLNHAYKLNNAMILIRTDAFLLPFKNNSADCIFLRAFYGGNYFDRKSEKFRKDCYDILKPGGYIIQTTPSVNMTGNQGEDPITVRYLSEKDLEISFQKAGYSKIKNYFTDLDELKKSGSSALSKNNTKNMLNKAKENIKFYLTVTFGKK